MSKFAGQPYKDQPFAGEPARQPDQWIEAQGDKPKVKRTREHFRAIFAGLRVAEEVAREQTLENESLYRRVEELEARIEELEGENRQWLAWSSGQYPDDSPGDVIAWEADGTITLDDSVTTWNPLRALKQAERRATRLAELLDEWLALGNLPGGGYGGTLEARTKAALSEAGPEHTE